MSEVPLAILAADEGLQASASLERIPPGYAPCLHPDWRDWTPERLLEVCQTSEVVITGRHSPRLPRELIDDRGRLVWHCHLHGTVKHLVSREHIEAGLIVTNWGESIRPVGEGAVALLLCALKQLPALDRLCRTGEDRRVRQEYHAVLRGLDVGLYGFGPIGRQTGEMLRAFGARVAIFDPYVTDPPPDVRICGTLEELFETCQAVSIHCGLNDATRGSVTGELMDLLPTGGIVVNTARGAIVDERALADRLAAGRLLAGIDVIADESDWSSSPLAELNGVVLSRHRAGRGSGWRGRTSRVRLLPEHAVGNLRRYLIGEPLAGVITPEEYDIKT